MLLPQTGLGLSPKTVVLAEADSPLMIGQIQVVKVPDLENAKTKIKAARKDLLATIARINPTINMLGGGPKGLKVRIIRDTSFGPMLVVHLIMDVRDAMGANAINTALENISPDIERLSGGEIRLRILSNLADKRLARATCTVHPDSLTTDDLSGKEVVERILEAAAFAEADPYRAVTHNKGVMNGIDAVVIATGNDWRAVEAGAYGWANRKKKMKPLTCWSRDQAGNLCGAIELPLAVGTVGGATRVHPAPAVLLKMMGIKTAASLAEVIACVGLAQNFAALRALVTEGIQKGHMALHARQVAITAGAVDDQIEKVTKALCAEGVVRADRAKEILDTL